MTRYFIFETSWGPFGCVANDSRLLATYLPQPEADLRTRITADWPQAAEWTDSRKTPPGLASFRKAIEQYFSGKPVEFDIELDLSRFSYFQQAVLRACQRISYGETATYQDLARSAGRPGAARAVGTTMAHNPMPIVIPCHRVVRSDGSLGGFSSTRGVEEKQTLLQMEEHARAAV